MQRISKGCTPAWQRTPPCLQVDIEQKLWAAAVASQLQVVV
jgi:hypothetical protein